jgi:hypothetical protein
MTYCPAHAKSAIIEIKNSIFERMSDVIRLDGDDSYQKAVHGLAGGIDYKSSTMSKFIGTEVLPELLSMGKVGVLVDRSNNIGASRLDQKRSHPYLTVYKAEQILSWAMDEYNQYTSLLLEANVETTDPVTGLINGYAVEQRLWQRTEDGVTLRINGGEPTSIALSEIPFVLFEIGNSLLCDVADYQIALLNIASSDMRYTLQANFPFYTEQVNQLTELAATRITRVDENGKPVLQDGEKEVPVGPLNGRQYSKGLERPGFIAPPTDPLLASMQKQKDLKTEIRELVHLAVSELGKSGLEAGLSAIGLVLEAGERLIAEYWASYMGGEAAVVRYPDSYTLRTDTERQEEAKSLKELLPSLPSKTFQKAVAKRIASLTVGTKVDYATMKSIEAEIDEAEIIAVDPQVLRQDLEAGLVAAETASIARGYPEGDVAIAKAEHINRLKAIAIAQSQGAGSKSAINAARGVETDPLDHSADDEKHGSQSADLQPAGAGRATRK